MTVPTVAFSVVMSERHGRHLSGLRDAADLEREVHAERLLHVQFDTVLRRPEALQLSLDQIDTGGIAGNVKAPTSLLCWVRVALVPTFCAVTVAPESRHPRSPSLHR